MTTGLMIDCESLDTSPTAALLSVGLVEMDLDSLTIGKKKYLRIDADDCMKHGMTVSADTIRFWSEQDPKFLRDAFNRDDRKGDGFNEDNDFWNPLHLALPKISNFIESVAPNEVWACGSRDFDWLETAYKAKGMPLPWKFYQQQDFRTMRNQFQDIPAPTKNGQKHHALADAEHQANHLLAILKIVRKLEVPLINTEEEEL